MRKRETSLFVHSQGKSGVSCDECGKLFTVAYKQLRPKIILKIENKKIRKL